MKVFKFGGASIQSAEAIQNMVKIVRRHLDEPMLIVVSAMGKTTNLLEQILTSNPSQEAMDQLEHFHKGIAESLATDIARVDKLLATLKDQLLEVKPSNFPFHYDQVVSFGELLSSVIISDYLSNEGISCELLHAPDLIRTDSNFTRPLVDWEQTRAAIQSRLQAQNTSEVYLTQGFIAGDGKHITTLGREGSDYSAALFAVALQAPSLTVWKDVPGIMNGDPKKTPGAQLYNELSYKDASEMTYYGAKVIHPDTIKPLSDTGTELHVRSFTNPEAPGTRVHANATPIETPCIIYKEGQCIISFRIADYEFVDERHLVTILDFFHARRIRVNLMQNSAISFSVCIDFDQVLIEELLTELRGTFEIHYNTHLTLLTIKSYREDALATFMPKNILMEQRTRADYQVVYRHEPSH